MRRGRGDNTVNILFAVDGDLRRGKHTDIRAAAFGYLEEAVIVYRRHDKTYLIYMSVEQDMHPVAARVSAHTAERIDMSGHILFEHGFCKQSRLIFIA